MKKNLLFVMPSLSAGGGERSLINLLSQLDYKQFNVDLFLFSKTGLFINSIPDEVEILELPINHNIFANELKKSLGSFLKNGQVNLAYSRLMFTIRNRMIKESAISEQYTWKFQSKSFDILEKEYDAAIGYLEKSSIYFVVEKVKAQKKIGWVHTNYSNSGMDYHFDIPYFKQLDHIITVSKECAESLKEIFIDLKGKVKVIYNIVTPKIINDLSNKKIQESHLYHKEYINIITVARLSHEKGIDIAINSCKILVENGYNVMWCVLGDGNERRKLESLIEHNGLKKHFKLLGTKENPYPYIKKADIYVQPSRYEGKSIAIDEAKILHKPIVITNFETSKDQINDQTDGIIVDMTDKGIAMGIETLIKDTSFRNHLISNLSKEDFGNEDELKKLYKII